MAIIIGGQTLAPSVPHFAISTTFGERSSRWRTTGSSGGVLLGSESNGVQLKTTSTASRNSNLNQPIIQGTGILKRKPMFRCNFSMWESGTDFTGFVGIAHPNEIYDPVGEFDGTAPHVGIKIVRVSNGMPLLYATMGNGSSGSSAQMLSYQGWGINGNTDVVFKIQDDDGSNSSISSVDFYYSINNGLWSSATNLTNNGPDWGFGNQDIFFGCGNADVADNSEMYLHTAQYEFFE